MAHMYGNWLGVLKWSLAQSDGTRPSEVKPMDEETKKWLMEALESLTVDEAKRMKELAEVLKAPPPGPDASDAADAFYDGQLDALDELETYVEGLDNAKNLFVIGGFSPLMILLTSSPSAAVRARAAEVVSTVVQNNPKAQEWALQAGTLRVLAQALMLANPHFFAGEGASGAGAVKPAEGEGGSGESGGAPASTVETALAAACVPSVGASEAGLLGVRAAATSALSSMTRDNAAAQDALLEGAGPEAEAAAGATGAAHVSAFRIMLQAIGEWDSFAEGSSLPPRAATAGRRLVRKALFFLRHLVCGPRAAAVVAACVRMGLDDGKGAGAARTLVQALTHILATARDPEADADVRAVRENALAVLLALASPIETTSDGVIDDSGDKRQVSFKPGEEGLQGPARAHSGGGGPGASSAAAPMLALGNAPAAQAPPAPASLRMAANSVATYVAEHGALPAHATLAVDDVAARRAAVLRAAAEGATTAEVVAAHAAWLASLQAEEDYEEELQLARALAALH